MITPALSNAPTAAAAVSHESDSSRTATAGPYALPHSTAGAAALDAARTAASPFVPAPWRGQRGKGEGLPTVTSGVTPADPDPLVGLRELPAATTDAGLDRRVEVDAKVTAELPWIDAFSDIPEMRTVSQVTREEQREQESSFVDETLFPACTDALDAGTEEPSVAGRLSFLTPLPDEVETSAERESVDEGQDLISLFGSDVRSAPLAALTPSFESAWEDADPINDRTSGEESVRVAESSDATEPHVSALTEVAHDSATEIAETGEGEDWPLAQAADSVRRLADALPTATHIASVSGRELGRPYATPLGVPPIAMTPPLPMWDDEEGIDIMPVKLDPATSGDSGHWSLAATGPSIGSREVGAAVAIEAIAQRIRRGELAVPGYTEGMSDAATLACALTALLSATP